MLVIRLVAFLSVFSVLVACVSMTGNTQAAQPSPYLEKDSSDLARLLAGLWSNDRQIFFAQEAGYDQSTLAPPQVLKFTPDEDVADTLVAEAAIDGGAPVHWRSEISANGLSGRVLQTISKDDGSGSGCRVAWQRQAGGFSGEAREEGCASYFSTPGGAGQLALSLSVSDRELEVIATRGDRLSEMRMRRTRPFSCWVAVLKGAAHGDSGEGLTDWDFREAVSLHDQGGEAIFTTAETPAREIRLKLRDVDWPYGTRRPSLTLYVHEGENPRAVSYAWTEGGADRVGINLRWIQASCTREGASD